MAKVEDIGPFLSALDRVENTIAAVGDVEIGFALFPVTKDFELLCVKSELFYVKFPIIKCRETI